MEVYDKGSAIRVQTEHKTTTPFSTTETLYDPTTVTITVIDIDGTVVVDGESCTNHATGQYYYIIQSLPAWIYGVYTVTTTATGPTYDDTQAACFGLK